MAMPKASGSTISKVEDEEEEDKVEEEEEAEEEMEMFGWVSASSACFIFSEFRNKVSKN